MVKTGTVLLCRVNRTTRLYDNAYTTTAGMYVIPAGTEFRSFRQYTSANGFRMSIDEVVNGDNVPLGYWCPSNVLKYQPDFDYMDNTEENEIENSSANIPVKTVVKKFKVTGNHSITYSTYMDSLPCGNMINRDDIIDTDKEVSVGNRALYRISDTTGRTLKRQLHKHSVLRSSPLQEELN